MKDRPSVTALRVAMRRAAHQILDRPLVFSDPLAFAILGEERANAVRSGRDPRERSRLGRILRAFLAARSRFAEEELEAAVSRGVRQVAVLGAGLDTLAYRNLHPESGLRIFEIDHPATQRWKRSLLARGGIPIPASLNFVALDFEARPLRVALEDAGFDASRPAFFSWLGVVPYLEREAAMETLRFIASLPERSSVVFDYAIPPSNLSWTARLAFAYAARRVAAAGEPWRTFFEPRLLREELSAMGFREIDDLAGSDINARYFEGRTDRLRVGKAGHIVAARR